MKRERFQFYPVQLSSGREVANVAYLTDALWDAFAEFYDLFLLGSYADFDREFRIPQRLRDASQAYFAQMQTLQAGTGQEAGFMADVYFDNFSIVTQEVTKKNRQLWRVLFQFVHTWEKRQGFRLHKGVLFYCWSSNVLLSEDLPAAFVLLHRAYEEDERRCTESGVRLSATPAHDFMAMRPKPNDPLYAVTLEMIRFLADGLDVYQQTCNGRLTYADMRQKFLESAVPDLEDIRFFFLFTILRLIKLHDLYSLGAADKNVASMLFGNAVTGLIVITEELFRIVYMTPSRSKQSLTFINYMQDLANEFGWTDDQRHYHSLINNAHLTRENFADILDRLLTGTYRTRDGRSLHTLERDLVLAYQLRNFTAHSIQSQEMLWDVFPDVLRAVLNCVFVGIEKLPATFLAPASLGGEAPSQNLDK